jgi:hypothetical protein
MKSEDQNPLDKLFREKLKDRPFEFQQEAWEDALELLEENQRGFNLGRWGLAVVAILVIGSALIWAISSHDTSSDQLAAVENPVIDNTIPNTSDAETTALQTDQSVSEQNEYREQKKSVNPTPSNSSSALAQNTDAERQTTQRNYAAEPIDATDSPRPNSLNAESDSNTASRSIEVASEQEDAQRTNTGTGISAFSATGIEEEHNNVQTDSPLAPVSGGVTIENQGKVTEPATKSISEITDNEPAIGSESERNPALSDPFTVVEEKSADNDPVGNENKVISAPTSTDQKKGETRMNITPPLQTEEPDIHSLAGDTTLPNPVLVAAADTALNNAPPVTIPSSHPTPKSNLHGPSDPVAYLRLFAGAGNYNSSISGSGAASIIADGSITKMAPNIGLEYFAKIGGLYAGSGLHYTQIKNDLSIPERDFSTITIQTVPFAYDTIVWVPDSNVVGGTWDTLTIVGFTNDTTIESEIIAAERSEVIRSYVTIPLLMAYHKRIRNWSLGVAVGPTVGFLIGQKGIYPSEDLRSNSELPTEYFRKVQLGYMLRPSIHYHFAENLSVGIEPFLNGQLITSAKDGVLKNERFQGMGVGFGLVYWLGKPTE